MHKKSLSTKFKEIKILEIIKKFNLLTSEPLEGRKAVEAFV